MKRVKTLSAALAAAIAAMALIGASSASATTTVICKENVLACPTGKKVENAEVHSLATDPKLLTNLGTLLCEYALAKGEVLTLAAPLQFHLSELNYVNCTLGSTSCTITTTHLGLPHLLKTAPNLGEVLDTSSGGFFTQVQLVCGKVLNCEYKGESLVGHAIGSQAGGVAGSVEYSGSAVKVAGGILCPSTSELDAVFIDLHATELFISE